MADSVKGVLRGLPSRLAFALVQAGVGFVATPYLTRALGPAEFGLLGLTYCAAGFAQPLASFCADWGAGGAKGRLEGDELVRHRNGILTFTAINFLVLLLVAVAIAGVWPDFAFVVLLAPVLGAIRFLAAFELAESGQERLGVRQSVLDAASGAFALVLTVVLISGFGLPWPARVAAVIAAELAVSLYRYGVLSDKLSRYRPLLDLGNMRRVFARGVPLMAAMVATLGMNYADRLFALAAFGLVQVGFYVAAFRVATMLTGVNRTVALMLVPVVDQHIRTKAPLGGLIVLHLAFGGTIMLIGLGVGAVFLEHADLVLGPAFREASPLIALVCIAYSLQGFQRIAGIIRQHFGMEAPGIPSLALGLAVLVAAAFALLADYGTLAPAIGVTAGYAATTALSIVTAYRRLLAERR